MRTVKEPDVRKQEILEGAIRVFARCGYDKTTIATLAKELNISQGLCYRYFSSKEDIYRAAIEKYAHLICEEYLRGRQEERTIREWLDGIGQSIDRLTEAEEGNKDLYVLFHAVNSRQMHNELLLQVAAGILPHIQQILRTAKEKGEIWVDDPERMAIIGLYGELGLFFVDGIGAEERAEAIRVGWSRLLGLE